MTEGERFTIELEKREERDLEEYALHSKRRRDDLGNRFRTHSGSKQLSPLEYRTEYHRDRDRLLWSSAFRRLQHKTQVFPHYAEDHYRRRLTHSLEVAQIAGTLSRALKLNEIVAEAIALGHDIGHAPFGHAGERALNDRLLSLAPTMVAAREKADTKDVEIDDKVLKELCSTGVLLYGFDHCVQGVEQISRVSQDYRPVFLGLNLSFDVRDGILKHIYGKDSHEEATENGRPFSALENIVRLSEFKAFGVNRGSLEAQCVWFADKVAYLLGDMEDAHRAKILDIKVLVEHSLVGQLRDRHEAIRGSAEKFFELTSRHDFLAFKRKALTVLILNCVQATTGRLRDHNIQSVKDVLNGKVRYVDVDDKLRAAWDTYYQTMCVEGLFRHEEVMKCEFKARKIVGDLFDAYLGCQDIIPREFRNRTQEAYATILVNERQIEIMAVRNYLAGMTDSYATEQHKRLFMSSERAGVL